ncbi:gliding motility lipoprotein GldB [Polaribacter septentrionalilitoris]|uniref:gliding motility lipoprotein GldB n=1 Tax=Polaribacter septentrionalilitoris TaxID=2494657 RepID=UPI0013588C21|nr:gliding motility lipoprotein GldB [Polaribacter septentrionalilitoris]
MRFFFTVIIVLCLFFSCSDKKLDHINVSDITIDYSIKRYDLDFYSANKKTLPKVKAKYPYLFPKQFSDSLAIAKINDKDEQELFTETQKVFQDISKLKSQISSLFKHIKYYNTNFKAPNVITMLTNIDYDSRVIYADSLLFISLDVYLGKEHKFYADYPKYIKENNTKDNIIVDVAQSIIETQFLPNRDRSFINKMIYEGKKMFVLDKYLPNISDKLKIGYQIDELNWVIENEEQVWKYFIERKLLFSTDIKLNKRFLDNAPFSKFYLEADKNSPGRIGVWIGWQIVKSYMKHNDVSLQKLIQIKPEDLFKKSKYKPKK